MKTKKTKDQERIDRESIDRQMLGSPEGIQFKGDYFTVEKKDSAIFRIVASTPDVDRDEEIVEPTAVNNLDAYLKINPVILFAHDHWSRPPIAKAVGGQIKPRSLELDIEFAPTPFAQEIKSLYEGGFMNTFSIGFIPVHRETTDEGRVRFTEIELLEVSAVNVPANANATMMRALEGACQKGLEFPIMESIVGGTSIERSKPEPKGESAEKLRMISLADEYILRGKS